MQRGICAVARRATAVLVAVSVVGCSTTSKDISATYVSPTQYQVYDCTQLSAETQRLQARYVELGGRLDQAASNDKAIMGVGLILFWPALFALGGTKQQEAEYGRLRGEHDAVQQTMIQKKCGADPKLAAAPATPALAMATSAPVNAPVVATLAAADPAASAPTPIAAASAAR